jgi:hypothetical protein
MKPRIRIYFDVTWPYQYAVGYRVPPGRECYHNGPTVSRNYASMHWPYVGVCHVGRVAFP